MSWHRLCKTQHISLTECFVNLADVSLTKLNETLSQRNMFAGPRAVTMLFMRAMDSREVQNLRHACKTAVNVRQRSANASCSHSFPERGDGALHMPDKKA